MFLFLRLVLAHLIADFLLQPDEIYRAKRKGLAGALIHYLIILGTFVLFCFPYLGLSRCWLLIAFVVLTHSIQDEIKLRIDVSVKLKFAAFVLDQILHIAGLCFVFFLRFGVSRPVSGGLIDSVYNNDSLVVFLSGYILSVFAGIYLWESFKDSYFKKAASLEGTPFFNTYVVKYGMFERFVITASFLNTYSLALLLLPLIFRFSSKKLSFSSDLAFNLLYASLIGLFLRRYLPLF